ncbi:FxsA family protein [Paracoccus sp. (in: a-proteobacteria)]|uniref:FxsA family protein n=1 Tax=Paracoccus sp. TaxID=267 RepID=UPI0028A07668|nr:FxsA family protein [Paracoccus sp. (in: a-proteobacteria)]
MRLFWAFLLLPIIEIALFVVIGGEIGVWATLGWIILAGVLGMALIRQQGAQAALDFQQSLQQLRDPSESMGQRSLKMLAGVLLIVPGFFTDFLALLLLVPGVRRLILSQIAAKARTAHVSFGFPGQEARNRDAGVIDGEYVIQDDPYVPQSGKTLPGPDHDDDLGNSGWTRH